MTTTKKKQAVRNLEYDGAQRAQLVVLDQRLEKLEELGLGNWVRGKLVIDARRQLVMGPQLHRVMQHHLGHSPKEFRLVAPVFVCV